MTYDETLAIMGALKAAYPAYYKGMERKDAEAAVALWAEMFADDNAAIVTAAVKTLISSDEKGYPPHIGAVKSRIRLLTVPQAMTEQAAWSYVAKAIKNSGYSSKEEFEKLPPTIRSTVHAPEQLKEWAMMDADTIQSVIASNFMRSYRARTQSEKEIAAIPADVKLMLERATSGLMLDKPSGI